MGLSHRCRMGACCVTRLAHATPPLPYLTLLTYPTAPPCTPSHPSYRAPHHPPHTPLPLPTHVPPPPPVLASVFLFLPLHEHHSDPSPFPTHASNTLPPPGPPRCPSRWTASAWAPSWATASSTPSSRWPPTRTSRPSSRWGSAWCRAHGLAACRVLHGQLYVPMRHSWRLAGTGVLGAYGDMGRGPVPAAMRTERLTLGVRRPACVDRYPRPYRTCWRSFVMLVGTYSCARWPP